MNRPPRTNALVRRSSRCSTRITTSAASWRFTSAIQIAADRWPSSCGPEDPGGGRGAGPSAPAGSAHPDTLADDAHHLARGHHRACRRDAGLRRRHGPSYRTSGRRSRRRHGRPDRRRSTRWPSKPASIAQIGDGPSLKCGPSSQRAVQRRGERLAVRNLEYGWPARPPGRP
jgi:hypothetical protein